MSVHGIFTPPAPVNEPIKSYVPGSPERAELKARLREMESERIAIPMVIGGKDAPGRRLESGRCLLARPHAELRVERLGDRGDGAQRSRYARRLEQRLHRR